MKKILLIIIMSIFLVSFISAISIGPVKSGDSIELTQLCSNCTYVNLTQVLYPNNTYALLGEFSMTQNGTNFNYTFSDTNTLGNYIYSTCGDLNQIITCQSVNFEITQTGFTLETSESNLYIVILISTFILFLAFLYPAIKLPYSNKVEKDGSIRRIVRAKYLKLLSIWFAYGFLMWFLQTLNLVTVNFIKLTNLSNFITNIFTYSWGLSVTVTFVILTIGFVELWKDIVLSETIKRYGKAFTDGRLN